MPFFGLNWPISLDTDFYAFHNPQCVENCRPALMSIQTSHSTCFSTTTLQIWQRWRWGTMFLSRTHKKTVKN
jgi:hypothetical protein